MKKAKQLLAALLCLVMVVAVIPVAAPQANAAIGNSIVFNFGGANGAPTGGASVGATAPNWTMIAKSDTLGWCTWDSWTHTTIDAQNAGDYVALKVNIPEGGVYSTVANGYDWHSYSKYDVHMIPYTEGMDIEAAIKSFTGYIGSAGKSSKNAGDNYADEVLYDATLNAGEYVLAMVVKGIKFDEAPGGSNQITDAKSDKYYCAPATLTFTKKADLPAASVEATNYEISYYGAGSGKWEEMTDLSSVGSSKAWWIEYTDADGKTVGNYVTFKLKGLKEGSYKVNAHNYQYWSGADVDYYLVPASATNNEIAALTTASTAYIGRATCNNNAYTATNHATAAIGGIGVPEDGDYLLVAKCGVANYSMFLRGVEMVRYGEYVAPVAPSNFGEHYAYMTKIGSKCVLTVIGGIKDIAGYSEVGFEISVNDGAMTLKQGGANVYETINYEGAAINTAKLGADVDYLFFETFEMDAADFAGVTSLKFKAYAEGAETEYGAEYALPLN